MLLSAKKKNRRPRIVEPLVGLASTLGDDAHSGRRAGTDWQAPRRPLCLLAIDGAGRIARCARPARYRVEKYDQVEGLPELFRFARGLVDDAQASEDERIRAVRLLGRSQGQRQPDIQSLAAICVPQSSGALQTAAVDARGADRRRRSAAGAGRRLERICSRVALEVLDAMLSRDPWAASAADRGRKP